MEDTTAGAVVDSAPVAEPQAVANDTPESTQAEPKKEGQQLDTAAELKRLQNALAREQRRIGKLTAQKHQFLREQQEIREKLSKYEQAQQPQTGGAPKLEQFETYDAFTEAQAKWLEKQVETKFEAREKKASESQSEYQQQIWKQERDTHLDSNADAAEAAFSDFTNVIESSADIIGDLEPHVHRAFLEADNGAFALYDLAQSGQLEKLNSMTPYQVAMVVARAEDRALTKSKQKPVTNAPAPLAPAKGTGGGSKSIDSMSGQELLKWIHS